MRDQLQIHSLDIGTNGRLGVTGTIIVGCLMLHQHREFVGYWIACTETRSCHHG